jgi:carbonic anhydrase/acetyltransferase-like protein (isoleucine patch superfamily)
MIRELAERKPIASDDVFIAPSAEIIGDVEIGARSSVWFNAVIRGDVGKIRIGSCTNIQDGSVLHMPEGGQILIGDYVTVGHRAIVHGCKVGSRVLVGMGSIIMNDVEIGDDCLIAAGALVIEKTVVPPRSLIMGVPAKVKRELSADEIAMLQKSADEYVELMQRYL